MRILKGVARILVALSRKNLLTPENHDVVKNHPAVLALFKGVYALSSGGLLTQNNFDEVKDHVSPEGYVRALISLHDSWILTVENRQAVRDHAIPNSFYQTLDYLWHFRLLNQANLSTLLLPANMPLFMANAEFGECVILYIFNRLPQNMINQTTFNDIIQLAQAPNIFQTAEAYVAQRLAIPLQQNPALNNAQSTHTASVHKSISESALKLKARYPEVMDNKILQQTLAEIKMYINTLPDSSNNNSKINAAKRCLTRITVINFTFEDPASKISIQQLLAVSFLVMKDDKSRNKNATFAEAAQLFVEGLYEIQRGYNFSAEGVDDGKVDNPICTSGTFNKLMEKLNGIDLDVNILVITKGLLNQKRPIIIEDICLQYLRDLASQESERKAFLSFCADINNPGINLSTFWPAIQEKVAATIFEEFGSLYKDNKNDEIFIAELEAIGESFNVSDVCKEKINILQRETLAKNLDAQSASASSATLFAAPQTAPESKIKDESHAHQPADRQKKK